MKGSHGGSSAEAQPGRSAATRGPRRASGIYGTIITAAVLAAVGDHVPAVPLAVSILVTLLVYWLAEEYAELLGEQLEGGHLPTWADGHDGVGLEYTIAMPDPKPPSGPTRANGLGLVHARRVSPAAGILTAHPAHAADPDVPPQATRPSDQQRPQPVREHLDLQSGLTGIPSRTRRFAKEFHRPTAQDVLRALDTTDAGRAFFGPGS